MLFSAILPVLDGVNVELCPCCSKDLFVSR